MARGPDKQPKLRPTNGLRRYEPSVGDQPGRVPLRGRCCYGSPMLNSLFPATLITSVALVGSLSAHSTQDASNRAPRPSAKQATPDVRLPIAQSSMPEAKAPEVAAELQVLWDGRVMSGEEVLFNPLKSDERKALRAWLSAEAGKMKSRVFPGLEEFGELTEGILLLHLDATAGMNHVQNLISDCAVTEPPIWRLHQSTIYVHNKGENGEQRHGRLDLSLIRVPDQPVKAEADAADQRILEEPAAMEVTIKVRNPGTKLSAPMGEPWSGKALDSFYFDRSTRQLVFALGPRRMGTASELRHTLQELSRAARLGKKRLAPLRIDPREGTTVADFTLVKDMALEANFRDFSLTAAE